MPRGKGYPAYSGKSGGKQGGTILRGNGDMRTAGTDKGLEGRYRGAESGGKQGGKINRSC